MQSRLTVLDDPRQDREVGSRNSMLDLTRIDDVRIGAMRPLITPALLQERVPVSEVTLALVVVAALAAEDTVVLLGTPGLQMIWKWFDLAQSSTRLGDQLPIRMCHHY